MVSAAAPKVKSQEKIGEACWMVPYRSENAKGVSVQNGLNITITKPVTMELMHTVGGVCGAISKFGTAAAQAHGIPAMPVGQPGHCAFLWKKDPQTWRTGNDISGWAVPQSMAALISIGETAAATSSSWSRPSRSRAFLASEQARWLAGATTDPAKSAALLQTAAQNPAAQWRRMARPYRQPGQIQSPRRRLATASHRPPPRPA